jgi:hypothetical protein
MSAVDAIPAEGDGDLTAVAGQYVIGTKPHDPLLEAGPDGFGRRLLLRLLQVPLEQSLRSAFWCQGA